MKGYVANYKAMEEKCLRLNELMGQIESNMANLEETVANLELFWSGRTSEAFFAEVQADFIQTYKTLSSFSGVLYALEGALREYQRGEKCIELKIGGLMN